MADVVWRPRRRRRAGALLPLGSARGVEYGFTDNYTASFYLNGSYQNFHNPVTNNNDSRLVWDGLSVENRYMLLNPADHAIGLTLYAEPRVSDRAAEMETKIIPGQRFAEDWKWALNLGHATEWPMNGKDVTEGKVELNFGITQKPRPSLDGGP